MTPERVDPVEIPAADLDPETAVEQLVLSAMLWSPSGTVTAHAAHLDVTDFALPVHRALLTAIIGVSARGAQPHPALVLAQLRDAGELVGRPGRLVADALTTVATTASEPGALGVYVDELLTQSLRRSISEAGHAMVAAAGEVPTAQLWEAFQRIGRDVRDGPAARLSAWRDGVPRPTAG
ncbi:DnaB-like helicase N-terminal domain-containing protein [Tsukamurella soli]|uniref:DNA helicase DnaB-like N-terminal domain-containing protein n=1 Tax=Tsukamurella soli TaxID=644556 RepID=A0ABP8J6S9_9ACTN